MTEKAESKPSRTELEKQVSSLEERAALLERERDEHLDDLKRVAAEFENYRKRVARDQASQAARASSCLAFRSKACRTFPSRRPRRTPSSAAACWRGWRK